MPDPDPLNDVAARYRRVLSRWDNEGGSIAAEPTDMLTDVPELTNTEIVQLRIRIIALENLLIAILSEGSDRQLEVARDMADHISPRPGFTDHPLTVQAAAHMTKLVDRVVQLRTVRP